MFEISKNHAADNKNEKTRRQKYSVCLCLLSQLFISTTRTLFMEENSDGERLS